MVRASSVMRIGLLAVAAAALTATYPLATHPAAKPITGSTISGPILVVDNGTPGVSFGDVVTFTISTTAGNPFVNLLCTTPTGQIASGTQGYWSGALNWPNLNFTLSSPSWTGGAATCKASIVTYSRNGHMSTLATTTFNASA